MAFLIGGANSAADTGFDVANSCRFNDDDSPYMHKTTAAGSRQIFTFSTWFKMGAIATTKYFISAYSAASDAGYTHFSIQNTGKLHFAGNATDFRSSNALLRDPSAWYHVVLAVDTTDGTAADRIKLYLNGTQITSLANNNHPDQNDNFAFNQDSVAMILGSSNSGGSKGSYWDGYLAETVWIDGTQYAASDFGEFDEDSPNIWKPKDVSGLTFGTNGFYLDYEDSSNLGNDANGGTDLTEVNLAAVDQASDSPTNSFATLNPLEWPVNAITFTEGNCVASGTSGNSGRFTAGTFAPASGKWWCEIKVTVSAVYPIIGKIDSTSGDKADATYFISGSNAGFAAFADDDVYHNDDSSWNEWQTYATDDIIGLGIDMDASTPTITFQKNGGSEETFTTEAPKSGAYNFPALGLYYAAAIAKCNFGGCPPYTISSAVADANGYGNFEYAPPSGYLSMCSKNIGGDS